MFVFFYSDVEMAKVPRNPVGSTITRPKCLLIVIGNAHVLKDDPHWGAFFRFCRDQGCAIGDYPTDDHIPRSHDEIDELLNDLEKVHIDEDVEEDVEEDDFVLVETAFPPSE